MPGERKKDQFVLAVSFLHLHLGRKGIIETSPRRSCGCLKKKDLFRLLSMKQLLLDRGVNEARSLSLSEVEIKLARTGNTGTPKGKIERSPGGRGIV